MTYSRKSWTNRESEYPNRYRMTSLNGNIADVAIIPNEGNVSSEGDRFDAETMNDMESRIDTAFSSVESNLSTQDNALRNLINAEKTRATGTENLLRHDVDTNTNGLAVEVTRAKNAESTIANNLTSEITRAKSIENGLSTNVTSLNSRVTDTESDVDTLTSRISSLEQTIELETDRAEDTETEIAGDLSHEITRATAAEAALRTSVNANTSSISQIASNLTTEVSRATQAESALHDYVDQQITRTYKPSGSVYFANLPTLAQSRLNNVYDIKDDFTTTANFTEGAGKPYKAGTNVAIIDVDGTLKYDCLPGSFVTGVKGDAETEYRTGAINITKANVGLSNVPNVTTNNQTPTFTQASTRANIASGEKLSIILGKIMKFFADIKTVAFTGKYSDLTGQPTIPTVNNGTLTIQKNGTNVQTFTANQSTNATANITMSKSDVGLDKVGNFKAVSTVANQGLTEDEKANARANIGAAGGAGSGTVTSVATGVGLTGGPISTSGTIKAKLKSETASTLASAAMGSTASRQYAVGVDKDGNLSVNIPWTDTNTHRPIQVNGTEILGNNTTSLNLKAGSNVSVTNSSGTVTIDATDTKYSAGSGLKLSGTTFSGSVPRVAKNANDSLPGTTTWILEEFTKGSDYNLPSNEWYFIFSMQGTDPNYGAQLALGMTTNESYHRAYISGTWQPWRRLDMGGNNGWAPNGASMFDLNDGCYGTNPDQLPTQVSSLISSYSYFSSYGTLSLNRGTDGTYPVIEYMDVFGQVARWNSNQNNWRPFRRPTGNATAAQVLSGYTFSNASSDEINGSMPNNGAVTKTLDTSTTSYTIPAGYHNGSGKVSITTEAKTATPSTSSQSITPSSGKVLSKVTVNAISPQRGTSDIAAGNGACWTYADRLYCGIDYGWYPAASYGGMSNISERYIPFANIANAVGVNANTVRAGQTILGVTGANHSATYTYPSGSTGGTVDLGAANTYRYVNAENVYNKGKVDGQASITHTLTIDLTVMPVEDNLAYANVSISENGTQIYFNQSQFESTGKTFTGTLTI